jgi:hypothetical protein
MPQPLADSLLQLSQNLLQAARSGDWDLVRQWEPEYVAMFPLFLVDATEEQAALVQLIRLNHAEILALAEQERNAIAQQLRGLAEQRKAGAAYTSIQTSGE